MNFHNLRINSLTLLMFTWYIQWAAFLKTKRTEPWAQENRWDMLSVRITKL